LTVETDPWRMSARELRQLPGVGHTLAEALARSRADPSVRSWQDVPGIGEQRARALEAWCRARHLPDDPFAERARERAGARTGYAEAMSALFWAQRFVLCALLPGCQDSRPESGPDAAPVAPLDPAPQARALLGGSLHALEAGPRTGATVILLHGGRYSAETWRELGTLTVLARAGYHALAIDWPGYGATPPWPDEPDPATLLERVCAEFGPSPVVLVGPSLGGGFALQFALRHPERLAALVAIAPAGAATFAPERWTVPTLLLWGAADEILPVATGRELAQRIGARLETFAAASHACYRDQPERYHELLFAFLTENRLSDAAR
jgi:hypothetical protein